MSSERFLEGAGAIGRRIVAEAIWHDGRCSWVGAVTNPAKRSRPEYRPVGPLLYGGTAGIALFLAHLFAATGGEPLRRTALGALRHAVDRAPMRHGFYEGTLGIAWAAALLGDEAPVPGVQDFGETAELGLRSGLAGTLVALLGLARESEASALGEQVLEHPGLLRGGLADGAPGVGAALAALADQRFREHAQVLLASSPSPATCAPPIAAPVSWCTGAAGLVFARATAGCPDANNLAALRSYLSNALPYAFDDLSLCHGAAGPALALLAAGEAELPRELGNVALDRYAARSDWPCGVYGTTPGLFRGLSGIGWFLLVLHNLDTRSPLALPGSVDISHTGQIRSFAVS